MNGTTPIYNNGLGRERIKQVEIDTLEAKIKVLQNRKKLVANHWKPVLDKARKERVQALENDKLTVASLRAVNENCGPKLVSYKKQLIEIASHPECVVSNKSQLELLSRDIKQDYSSSEISEVKETLKQLNLLTHCLKATAVIVENYGIIESKISQDIEQESADIDTQINQIKGQIATLKGYDLKQEMTAMSPVFD